MVLCDRIYNLTDFQIDHPGGPDVLQDVAAQGIIFWIFLMFTDCNGMSLSMSRRHGGVREHTAYRKGKENGQEVSDRKGGGKNSRKSVYFE